MKKNILIICLGLFTQNLTAQSEFQQDSFIKVSENNIKKIESYRTKLDKITIEKYLTGTWKFINIQTSEGKVLDSIKIEYYHDDGELQTFQTEKKVWSNLKFTNTNRYEIFDNPQDERSKGKWEYSAKSKSIVLTYDKQYYPNPMMKTILKIPGLKEESFFIYKITTAELYIMELYPVSDHEQWFYLRYYKK